MKRTPTALTAFAVVLVSVFTAALLAALLTWIFKLDHDPRSALYLSVFIGQGFMIVPLLVYLINRKAPLAKVLRLKPVRWQFLAGTGIISLGAMILSDELERVTELFFTPPESLILQSDLLTFQSPASALILITGIVFLAPLGEELLFRGFLQQFLETYWKDITRAVMTTALVFALIHINPYWMIRAYLFGILLGYLAWRSGSVFPAILMHALNNGLALVLNNYPQLLPEDYLWGEHVSPAGLLAAIILMGTGFLIFNHSAEKYT